MVEKGKLHIIRPPVQSLVVKVLGAFFPFVLLQSTAFASFAVAPRAVTPHLSKADVLSRLKDIQSQQNQELRGIDDIIKKRLTETTEISLKTQDTSGAERRILRLTDQIEEMQSRRDEMAARRSFLNDLIFAVDTKWSGEPLGTFLEHQFLDMSLAELTDTSRPNRIWKFLTYLSIAVREAPEPLEDPINVVESFMNFSSVLDPKSPAAYINNRSYTNGTLSYRARPISRDKVGDLVDERLKTLHDSLGKSATAGSKAGARHQVDIELRMNLPAETTGPAPGAPSAAAAAGAATDRPKPIAATAPLPTPTPSSNSAMSPTDGASIPPTEPPPQSKTN